MWKSLIFIYTIIGLEVGAIAEVTYDFAALQEKDDENFGI